MRSTAQGSSLREPRLKINLGCGLDARPGWVNLDKMQLPGVDVVHDIMMAPWPFGDGAVDHIEANHVLEHVPHEHASGRDGFLVVMEEVHRVLASGGILEVRVPHHENRRALESDPTHTRVVRPETWDYFSDSGRVPGWYTQARFRVVEAKVSRRARPDVQPISYLCWRFPFLRKFAWGKPTEMLYRLEKQASG